MSSARDLSTGRTDPFYPHFDIGESTTDIFFIAVVGDALRERHFQICIDTGSQLEDGGFATTDRAELPLSIETLELFRVDNPIIDTLVRHLDFSIATASLADNRQIVEFLFEKNRVSRDGKNLATLTGARIFNSSENFLGSTSYQHSTGEATIALLKLAFCPSLGSPGK